MNKKGISIRPLLPAIGLVLIASGFRSAGAQDQRWIAVGETQSFFIDYGAECQLVANQNFLTWPTQYGDNQHTARWRGFWIGAKNFKDPLEGMRLRSVKVIGAGPRLSDNQLTMIFPKSLKLIARTDPPIVIVDGQIGSNNTLYDLPDDVQDTLSCDRMIIIKFNTSMGVSVTKKVMGFVQQNHDNYFIHDYVFKNTGIFNEAGGVYKQTLQDVWIYFTYRYAFAGVTSSGWGSTWGSFDSEWGGSTLYSDFGSNPEAEIRGFYSWYGPNSGRPVTRIQDWGCPNQLEDGLLGSAKYAGVVTLLASKNPQDWNNDNSQPRTTAFTGSDGTCLETTSQFDELLMQARYNLMTEGHLAQTQAEYVGERYSSEAFPEKVEVRKTQTTGSSSQGQGFGPYTLADGDSIRIVFAEGVNGIGWPKCREVGANWFAYYLGTSKPELKMPDGSVETDHTMYTRAWCETGRDSIMQTLRNAQSNFKSGYKIPQPPPAPKKFIVTSGGDRIRLTWADNAVSDPHFNGYVIYRSEDNVKEYRTVYKKLFECDASNAVHQFDDVTAVRGFNYYYYIQSKDDGRQNDAEPGKPLYSSLFLTLTTVPAYLLRSAGMALSEVRVVPNPYDIRARIWQFGDETQVDRIAFYELPPQCKVRVYTERGDLIWEKEHTTGSGDELWDSMTSSRQIVVSGIYLLYVEVTEDTYASEDTYAKRTYIDPETKTQVYRKGDLLYKKGDKMYNRGDSVYRKFVVIR